MCGYCMEEIAIDVVKKEAKGQQGQRSVEANLSLYFRPCLQEAKDFLAAVEIANDVLYDLDEDQACNEVILCRTLEIVFKQGFDSDYWKLIENKTVRQAIRKKCSHETKNAVLGSGFPFVDNCLLRLYEAETYFEKERWSELLSDRDALAVSCRQTLRYYVDWWLLGKGLSRNDRVRNGIVDGLNERNKDECYLFELFYRLFFFGTMLLPYKKDDRNITYQLLTNNPSYLPDFSGMDLWLQRIAIIRLANSGGIASLLPYDPAIRPALIYYMATKIGMDKEGRKLLSDSMLSSYDESQRNDRDLRAMGERLRYGKALVEE
ncbi:MAG: hypothetical protein DRH43_03740 [Deltaproteobacteria bacterium]|nr:MAG: hypothetical protein DRH43_03740 [Deltaproteobacteria bacterium]